MRIGERPGTSNAKHETNEAELVAMNAKTLYQFRLLDLARKTAGTSDADNLDRRIMDVVNMRGIKFCRHFTLVTNAYSAVQDDYKLYLNVAIISPKAGLDDAETIPNTNFFRNDGSDRAVDFNEVTLTALDYKCNPINTDLYNVHEHKRYIIGPFSSTGANTKELHIEKWMPLKRQIRYANASPYPEGKNMYMLYWFVPSNNAPTTSQLYYSHKYIKYFRETGGF
jgi:hypothetical protein